MKIEDLDRFGIRLMGDLMRRREGAFCSEFLTRQYLDRIGRLNPKLNAFLKVFTDEALERARAADAELARGEDLGPLHGIPIAIKDNIDVRGHATTAGGVLLPDAPATEDAEVVARLRRAGAVILGKLNLHEYAWGGTTDNVHYGRCHNPWGEGLTPGGSSGGAGAAVAARLCAAAIGSDTLGSIRIPASYCGVVGLKPTNGLVSGRGVFPLSWSLDTAGPLTRSVEDAELLFRAIAAPDADDPYSAMREAESLELDDPPPADFMRIGVIRDWALEHDGSPARKAVVAAMEEALKLFVSLGCRRADLDLPQVHDAQRAAYSIAFSDAAAIHKDRIETHPERIGPDVLDRLRRGAAMTGTQVAEAHHRRAGLRRLFAERTRGVDCLLSPTTLTPAHTFDPLLSPTTGWFTAPFNLLGWPAISIPAGMHERLPIGMMLAAPPFEERKLLKLAKLFESESFNWFSPPE